MPDAQVVEWIRSKYLAVVDDLGERGRRRWAAAESRSLGWGGISAVAKATGISDRTIRNGVREFDEPDALLGEHQRKPGAGRLCREEEQPRLVKALGALIEPVTRGDPMSPLRWTCKSTRVLAEELKSQGFVVSSTKVGALLKLQGYSLQSNRKTIEGKQHPDRNGRSRWNARCGWTHATRRHTECSPKSSNSSADLTSQRRTSMTCSTYFLILSLPFSGSGGCTCNRGVSTRRKSC